MYIDLTKKEEAIIKRYQHHLYLYTKIIFSFEGTLKRILDETEYNRKMVENNYAEAGRRKMF